MTTAEQAAEIRVRLAAGEKNARLAEEFDVWPSTITKIKKGLMYRPGPRRQMGRAARSIDPAGRNCTHCEEFKPWEDFSPLVNGRNGRRADCKACVVKKTSTPERRREQADRRLRRQFGISLAQFEEILALQDGVCALCCRPERAQRRDRNALSRLHVDHDHSCCPGTRSCGKCLRGLLCNHCNRVAGQAEQIPHFVERLPEYLTRRLAT